MELITEEEGVTALPYVLGSGAAIHLSALRTHKRNTCTCIVTARLLLRNKKAKDKAPLLPPPSVDI